MDDYIIFGNDRTKTLCVRDLTDLEYTQQLNCQLNCENNGQIQNIVMMINNEKQINVISSSCK